MFCLGLIRFSGLLRIKEAWMPDLPNAFESLAGICKFIAAEHVAPDFCKKYFSAIEMANAFVRVLATTYPELDAAFRKSLPLPPCDGAVIIQEAFQGLSLDDEKFNWIGAQMRSVLMGLLPVVESRELPSVLVWAKDSIQGAFHTG